MRKWILRVHMYGGLLLFGFIVVFAFSAICFNHDPSFMNSGRTESRWTHSISAPPQPDPWVYAAAVQDELDVTGRILHPVFSKQGDLKFDVAAPGRRYTIRVSHSSADIYEYREGWIATLVELHGVRPTTRSLVLKAWAWYSAIGALALVGSGVTGVYLWASRPRERIIGWSLLGGATLVSLLICVYIRAWG
jgi:hypothetical protein